MVVGPWHDSDQIVLVVLGGDTAGIPLVRFGPGGGVGHDIDLDLACVESSTMSCNGLYEFCEAVGAGKVIVKSCIIFWR